MQAVPAGGSWRPPAVGPAGPRGRPDLEGAKDHAPDDDHVAVAEVRLLHAAPVDEGAVGAAVIEDAGARDARHEDRVAARDRALVQPNVGLEPAPDVDRLASDGEQERAPGAL